MQNNDLTEKVIRLQEQTKQNTEDIKEIKNQTQMIYEINTNIQLLVKQGVDQNCKIDKVEKSVEQLTNDISEVKSKNDKQDAANWNTAVKYVLTAICGAVMALVLKQIGLAQ